MSSNRIRRPAHLLEQLVEIILRFFRPALGGGKQFPEQPLGQKLHAVREKAEDELIDEMRDRLAVGMALLQRVGDGLELSAASFVIIARVRLGFR